jgi:hypothetical protein
MMKKSSIVLAAALFATPAAAALNNVTFSAQAPGFQGSGAGFEGAALGALPGGYAESGFTFTPAGSVQVKTPPSDGQGAFPFGDTSVKYLSVLGGASVDIATGTLSRVGFYWGSIDTYNTVEFYSGATLVGSLTGSDVAPLIGDGGQLSFQSNRHVTISLLSGAFDRVRLSSTSNSFEVDNISAGVPEPGTWAMMVIGFAGLAFMSRRKRRMALAPAVA